MFWFPFQSLMPQAVILRGTRLHWKEQIANNALISRAAVYFKINCRNQYTPLKTRSRCYLGHSAELVNTFAAPSLLISGYAMSHCAHSDQKSLLVSLDQFVLKQECNSFSVNSTTKFTVWNKGHWSAVKYSLQRLFCLVLQKGVVFIFFWTITRGVMCL